MKRYATILIIVGLLLASLSFTATVSAVPGIDKRWAIILCGYLEFQPDCQYMYDMIRHSFDGIYYLTGNYSDPRMSNPYPCKETLSIAIRDWLAERSDGDDLVFIFMESHGGGYNALNHNLPRNTWEFDSDEGEEICETDVGIDFNGNGVLEPNVWVGVDECIAFENQDELYWDDDAKEDLDWLAANGKYGKLVFFPQSCYGGGFVRDLSGENRIIISACNETSECYGPEITEDPLRVHGYFSRPFIDALNLDYGGFDEADVDGDNLMSVLETYQYAYNHDEARIQGLESPQLDDNGDGVSDSNDGSLASSVYFFQVFTLTVECSSGGWTLPCIPGTYRVKEGTVILLSAFEDPGYHFVWWAYSTSMISYNWYLEIEMDHDYTAYAYFLPNSGGGGGGTCPTLFVWNGTAWIDYGVIDIHDPSGEDMVRKVTVQVEDVGLNNHKTTFRLREGWEGLEFSESVCDRVQFYAVDNDGKRYKCPLVGAEHSRLGKVLSELLLSDDVRVETNVLETIDLTFVVPCQNVLGFKFVIEGCNMLKP